MKENPYSKLIEAFSNKNNAKNNSIEIAEVISASPLIIRIGDLQVDKDNILIADYLLENYKREYQTSSNNSNWSSTNYIKYTDTLNKGDLLGVMPASDKQLYIILARLKEV